MTQRLAAAALSNAGRVRSSNQDIALVDGDLVAVADGMGGHAGGEIAASTAVAALRDAFASDPSAEGLVKATERANRVVFERSDRESELRGMGTTLTAATVVEIEGIDRLVVVNVGDSRAYLLDGEEIIKLTEDHSLVEEMVRSGEISPEQALVHPHRHILTRAIGVDPRVDVDSWILEVHPGMRLLLCSDGLTNECSDEEIAEVLTQYSDRDEAVHALVERALGHGGNDNVTVVVADVGASQADLETEVAGAEATKIGTEAGEGSGAGDLSIADDPLVGDLLVEPAGGASPVTREQAAAGVSRRLVPPRRASRPRDRLKAPQRREGRRRRGERLVTVRVIGFFVVLFAIFGGLIGFSVWYVKASYFVGLAGNQVVIYQGRPGGFLWFQPTIVSDSGLTTGGVFPASLPLLRSGMLASSYAAARNTVTNLANENSFLHASTRIPSLPTTTLPPPTTSAVSGTTKTTVTTVATPTTKAH